MKQMHIQIPITVYQNIHSLDIADAELLLEAGRATEHAYAPYSKFRVGAALRMENGKIITGSNQENASFPAGICAERVALSSASATYPGTAVISMALTYFNEADSGNRPISPCGICRQSLAEYEQRFQRPIRLIMAGVTGEVFIADRATDLLPFAFSSEELKPY